MLALPLSPSSDDEDSYSSISSIKRSKMDQYDVPIGQSNGQSNNPTLRQSPNYSVTPPSLPIKRTISQSNEQKRRNSLPLSSGSSTFSSAGTSHTASPSITPHQLHHQFRHSPSMLSLSNVTNNQSNHQSNNQSINQNSTTPGHSHSNSISSLPDSQIQSLNQSAHRTPVNQPMSESESSAAAAISSMIANTATLHKAVLAAGPLNHLKQSINQPLMTLASLPPLALSFSSMNQSVNPSQGGLSNAAIAAHQAQFSQSASPSINSMSTTSSHTLAAPSSMGQLTDLSHSPRMAAAGPLLALAQSHSPQPPPINQQMSQPINQQMSQPINQQMSQPINQQMSQQINLSMNHPAQYQGGSNHSSPNLSSINFRQMVPPMGAPGQLSNPQIASFLQSLTNQPLNQQNNQTMNQPINQSSNQSSLNLAAMLEKKFVDEGAAASAAAEMSQAQHNQALNQAMNQALNQAMNQAMNQSMNQSMNSSMNQQINPITQAQLYQLAQQQQQLYNMQSQQPVSMVDTAPSVHHSIPSMTQSLNQPISSGHHSFMHSPRSLAWPATPRSQETPVHRYLINFPADTAHGAQAGLYQPGKPSLLCVSLVYNNEVSVIRLPVKVAIKPTVKRTAKLRLMHEISMHPQSYDCPTRDLHEEEKRYETGAKVKKPDYLLLRQDTKAPVQVVHVDRWQMDDSLDDPNNSVPYVSSPFLSPLHLIPVTEDSLAHVQTKGRGNDEIRRKETAQLYLSLKVDKWYELRCHHGYVISDIEMRHHKGGHQMTGVHLQVHHLPDNVSARAVIPNLVSKAQPGPQQPYPAQVIQQHELRPPMTPVTRGKSPPEQRNDRKRPSPSSHSTPISTPIKQEPIDTNMETMNPLSLAASQFLSSTQNAQSSSSHGHMAPLNSAYAHPSGMSPTSPGAAALYSYFNQPSSQSSVYEQTLLAASTGSPNTMSNAERAAQHKKLLALQFTPSTRSAFTTTMKKDSIPECDDEGRDSMNEAGSSNKRRRISDGDPGDSAARMDDEREVRETMVDLGSAGHNRQRDISSLSAVLKMDADGNLHTVFDGPLLRSESSSSITGTTITLHPFNAPSPAPHLMHQHPFFRSDSSLSFSLPLVQQSSSVSLSSFLPPRSTNPHHLPPSIQIPQASRMSPSLSPTLGMHQQYTLSFGSSSPTMLAPLNSYLSPTPGINTPGGVNTPGTYMDHEHLYRLPSVNTESSRR